MQNFYIACGFWDSWRPPLPPLPLPLPLPPPFLTKTIYASRWECVINVCVWGYVHKMLSIIHVLWENCYRVGADFIINSFFMSTVSACLCRNWSDITIHNSRTQFFFCIISTQVPITVAVGFKLNVYLVRIYVFLYQIKETPLVQLWQPCQ